MHCIRMNESIHGQANAGLRLGRCASHPHQAADGTGRVLTRRATGLLQDMLDERTDFLEADFDVQPGG